ncbi:MAG: SUMF1/EgtB/PvdO family nonheme iron enzyme [Verrucomicrobiota bacterium]
MVILIASDKTRIRRGLADRLRESTLHRVLAAASVAEMEALAEMEGALDLLVFSAVFSEPGKEARIRLRARFPNLQTVVLDDKTPLEQLMANLMEWVTVDPVDWAHSGSLEGKVEKLAENTDAEAVPAPSIPAGGEVRGQEMFLTEVEHIRETGADTPRPDNTDGEADDGNPGDEGILTKKADRMEGSPVILGDYELRELMGSTDTTLIYGAMQRSVRRTVILECLRPELLTDSASVKQFRQLVRAKALVSHPVIAAVYEAQETGEVLFYAGELVPGENLPALAAAGRHFPQQTLLGLMQATADAMVWMAEHDIPHDAVRPEHLLLGPNGTPRMRNPASPLSPREDTTAGSLAQLAAVCQRLSEPRSARTRELAHVVGLMRSPGSHGIHSWKALARETRNSLHRLTEAHTSNIPESHDRMLARRRRKRHFLGWAVTAVALMAGTAGSLMWWRRSLRAKVRNLDGLVKIPAGPFIFHDGQKVELPEFWIDRYEVTLAQYAGFLEALPQGPMNRFDHPDQPSGKISHQPRDWAEIHESARKAGNWLGHPLTLNSPVFNVDWWDAWAFAKWRGCRLPTEQEWEKAARGPDGRLWPWGNEENPGLANTGTDDAEHLREKGGRDGHSWWCDVDAMSGDITPEGVMGLAGNVAEWTATLVPDPDFPDMEVPVFRGGDFHRTVPVPLNAGPWLAKGPLYAQPFLGFRTASSKERP